MVKVSYKLSEHQQLVLYAIAQARSARLEYDTLKRTIEAVDAAGEFDKFLQISMHCWFDPSRFRAYGGEKPKSDFEKDFEGIEFLGLVTNYGHVELTVEGKRVARSIKESRHLVLRPRKELQSTVFVACAFGYAEIDALYEGVHAPAARRLGYDAVRIDMREPKKSITEAILEGIQECACLVADLTYARPSVYFEVGFAHGLGIPLLLSCRQDHHRGHRDDQRVHFDLEQYKISYWSRTPKGKFRWPKGMEPSKRITALIPKKEES